MGQARLIELLKEHGELSIKEMDELIDDMALGSIRRAMTKLGRRDGVKKRSVNLPKGSTYYKYSLIKEE